MSNYRRILALALPIMGGMLSQNLLDLVDTAMVGALGSASLAAVGIGAFTNFMLTALILGIGSGVQTLVARERGSGASSRLALPLNAGLIVVATVALPLSLVLMQFSDDILSWLSNDSAVVEEGARYLDVRLIAMTAVGANFCFRGYLNGIERSSLYLRIIVVVHILNVVVSYVLIFGRLGFPALGSQGAAIGTTLSLIIGTIMYAAVCWRIAAGQGFLRKSQRSFGFAKLLAISIPASVQTLFFATGLVVLFWIIGHISVDAVAASNVLVNLMKVGILPGVALGLAAMTLVSESIGQRQPQNAKLLAWQVVACALTLLGLIALPALIAPAWILSGFLDDPQVLELAVIPLRICAIAVVIDAIGIVLLNALIGASEARTAMVVSISTQWLFGLPVCYLAATALELGLMGVWCGQGLYRMAQAIILIYLWRRYRPAPANVHHGPHLRPDHNH